MAMLKTTISYASDSGYRRQRYAEKRERALVVVTSPLIKDSKNWGAEFDEHREMFGKNYHGSHDDRGPRKVWDFIISPDPADHARPEEVADLAREWVEARHPGHQWAIVVHDDNENGIVHAHVYVNSVEFVTGRMLHTNVKESAMDAVTLQELCAKRGWSTQSTERYSWLGDVPGARGQEEPGREASETQRRRDARRAQERQMELRGVVTWKSLARKAIDQAMDESDTWVGFLNRVEELGWIPKVTRRGITFYPRADIEGARPCKGVNLDNGVGDYSLEALRERMLGDAAESTPLLGREGRAVPMRYHDVASWREWRIAKVPKDPVERERLRLRITGMGGSDTDAALDWMHAHALWNLGQVREYEDELAMRIESEKAELAGLRERYDEARAASRDALEAANIRRSMANGRALSSDPDRLAELERRLVVRGLPADATSVSIMSDAYEVRDRIAPLRASIEGMREELEAARAHEQSLMRVGTRLNVVVVKSGKTRSSKPRRIVGWRKAKGRQPVIHVRTWRELVNMQFESMIDALNYIEGAQPSHLERALEAQRATLLSYIDLEAERARNALRRQQPAGKGRGTLADRPPAPAAQKDTLHQGPNAASGRTYHRANFNHR